MLRRSLLAALLATMMAMPAFAAAEAADGPKIQIAVLLDTSSSMDGLINQTREQLWRIVNTFATAKRDGKQARLELALYEYGNSSIPSGEQYVRQVVPLTTDLDKVSEALFSLRTNGGDEYCGVAIDKALNGLQWSDQKGDLKLIYIAGNEPFTQGPMDFHTVVKRAISHGVVVNTIHAGSEQEGIDGKWKEAAKLADGNFLFIDQNRAVARVNAPQDAELAKLNGDINKTYVGYGRQAPAAMARQEAQDKNAAGLSASSVSTRAAAKASAHYDNSGWDLVDAKKKGAKLDEMKAEELPAEMRDLKPAEREAYVAGKEKERVEIQAKIAKLSAEREKYVQGELAKRAKDGPKTMDDAVIESARGNAVKAKFKFE